MKYIALLSVVVFAFGCSKVTEPTPVSDSVPVVDATVDSDADSSAEDSRPCDAACDLSEVLMTPVGAPGSMFQSKAPVSLLGEYCCDAAGVRRCVLTSPATIGAACVCFGQGSGWVCG
jgi:hypothetical protein